MKKQHRLIVVVGLAMVCARCLQALPAPLLVEQPPGNPNLPGAVQKFTPPTDTDPLPAGVPVVSEFTRYAKPDQSIALLGNAFSNYSGSEAGKDSRFLVYGQSSTTNGILVEALVQRVDDSKAAITLPSSLPQDALYWLWPENDTHAGRPVAVNRTEAWWVGPDAASVGESVSVYGTNMASGSNRSTSYVYLVASGTSIGTWVTVQSANPYKVDFTVPAGLSNGNYEVWVHNGRGGAYGWSTPRNLNRTPMTLAVRSPLNWTGPTYNVRQAPYNAVGDGVANDAPAIQSALSAASAYVLANPTSRPTVYLPSGTYNLYQGISPVANVRILGDGRDANNQWRSIIQRAEAPRTAITFSGNANDLTGNNNNGTVVGNALISTATGAGWKTPFGSIAFDGASYVNIPTNAGLNFTGRFTVSTRIKGVVNAASPISQTLFAKSSGGQSVFARIRSGLVEFGYNLGAGDVVVSTPFNFNTSSTAGWATIVFSYDGTAWQIYQGDILKASRVDAQGAPSILANWTVGGDPNGIGGYLSAQMDTVRIYARSLSSEERVTFAGAYRDGAADTGTLSVTAATDGFAFDGLKFLNVIKPFIGQTTAGVPLLNLMGTDIQLKNLCLESGPFRGFSLGAGTYRFTLEDSDIIGCTNFSQADQVKIRNVNFYGTGDAEQLFAADGGSSYISISDCTGQDWKNTGLFQDSAGGRFFTGGVGAGSQRNIYLGDITTTDLAARVGKNDQNAGEQILWDQNAGNMVRRTLVSATANTVVIQEFIGVSGFGNTDTITVSGGRGIGQSRRILSANFTNGTVTLDRPWDVIPDSTSIVLSGKVVSNVAIYHNQLDGKSDYATRVTASSGINYFNNGFDTFIDSNTITDVRTAVNLNGYTQGNVSLPVENILVIKNIVGNVLDAFKLLGAPNAEQPALLATVWRENTVSNVTESGIEANTGVLNIFEGNSFTNLPVGVGFNILNNNRTENMVLRNNVFTRGTAALAGSIGIVTASQNSVNVDPVLTGNTFAGFEKIGANISSNRYSGRYYGMAAANNGKIYGVLNTVLTASPADVVQSFDPAKPFDPPVSFIQADAGGVNGHLQKVRDILFTNTTYAGPNANPVNCSMYLLNNGAGTLSKYDFNGSGQMTYAGEVVAGLGSPVGLARDGSGNIYILTTDKDLSNATALEPRLYKWNGSTLSIVLDTPMFRYGTNTTTRNPGGVALDAQGRIYIPFTDINGTRRFRDNGSGTYIVDYEIPKKGSSIKMGPDGKVYLVSGFSIVAFDPATNLSTTFADSSTLPAVTGQSSFVGLAFGPPPISDLTSGGVPNLYLATSGGYFLAAYGPGTTGAGTQVGFRDNVYPLLELPMRSLVVSGSPGSTASVSLALQNAGLVDLSYSLTSNQPWLAFGSGASGGIAAQGSGSAMIQLNGSSLATGSHSADITINYNNTGGTQPRVTTVNVEFVLSASQAGLSGLSVFPVGSNSATGRVTVDPNASATSVSFELGLSPLLTQSVSAGSVAANAGPTAVSAPLGGLFPHTTYYYRAVATNASGATQTDTQTFRTLPQSDVNGDGFADLVVLNPLDRSSKVILNTGTASAATVNGPSVPFDRSLCALADMNRDGMADWVMINPETRAVEIWMMNGTSVSQVVAGPVLAADYDVQAVEDMDGDGYSDLIVRNATTLALEIRRLDSNYAETGTVSLSPALASGMVVVGVDYLSAGGYPDIVTWNPATGATQLLTYDGTGTLIATNGTSIPAGWQLMGVDAYKGSTSAEWLVLNPTSRATEIWTMNGANKTASVSGPTLPVNTQLVGSRSAKTTTTTLTTRFYGNATANNGKVYMTMNATLGATAQDVVRVYDPTTNLSSPVSYMQGSTTVNSNLAGTRDIVFTNTAYAAPNANPVSCDMYLLNSTAGTVSKYTFDAAGNRSYMGEVITGLGLAWAMTSDSAGNLYIVSVDSNTSLAGNQPKLFKWNGTTLTTLIDTALFKYTGSTSIRTPGGVAVDSNGKIYIPFTAAGTRRFTAAGVMELEIPQVGTGIEMGPDNNPYLISALTIKKIDVAPSVPVIRTYVDSSQFPSIVGQSSFAGLAFGPKNARDLNPGEPFSLYLSTSGSKMISAHGPGSANPGSPSW